MSDVKIEYRMNEADQWDPSNRFKDVDSLAQGMKDEVAKGAVVVVTFEAQGGGWRITKAPPKTIKVTIELAEEEVEKVRGWNPNLHGVISSKVAQAVHDLRP